MTVLREEIGIEDQSARPVDLQVPRRPIAGPYQSYSMTHAKGPSKPDEGCVRAPSVTGLRLPRIWSEPLKVDRWR